RGHRGIKLMSAFIRIERLWAQSSWKVTFEYSYCAFRASMTDHPTRQSSRRGSQRLRLVTLSHRHKEADLCTRIFV
ncbi:hypothetical protein, partial [Sinorhizobium fredii]|uniref:hypothetical protein n=1 Tax=Rhizobium fredii TaxID=380 RepID=UPI001AEBF946